MRHIVSGIIGLLIFSWMLMGCGNKGKVSVMAENDTTIVLEVEGHGKYLIVPVEESAAPVQIYARMGKKQVPYAKIRLAQKNIDYYAAVCLPEGLDGIVMHHVEIGALCLRDLKAVDKYEGEGTSKTPRPRYHYTPSIGWMGRLAGAVYQDGTYHLFYETNPNGCQRENVHWGHAVSENLTEWTEKDVVLGGDSIGEPLGGSVIVDKRNVFGAGKNALIAMFTATCGEGAGRRQEQCLAYSSNGGVTFEKFATNPVMRTYDDNPDFRHPNVVRYQKGNIWEAVIACGEKLRIYSSDDLGSWNLENYLDDASGCVPLSYVVGEHLTPEPLPEVVPQYENAQMIEIPVEGGGSRWTLICSLVESITKKTYVKCFIGTFDGRKFIADDNGILIPDFGHDYGHMMAIQETGDRCLALGWMGSEEYDGMQPTMPYRGQMALPRELTLREDQGKMKLVVKPAQELEKLRGDPVDVEIPDTGKDISEAIRDCDGSYELLIDDASEFSAEFINEDGEKAVLSLKDGVLAFDRTKAGWLAEGKMQTCCSRTLPKADTHKIRVYVDKTSIEVFADEGEATLTEAVFPSRPLTGLRFVGNTDMARTCIYGIKK